MKHGKRATIMVIAPDAPCPVHGGGRMRMASLMEGMAGFADVCLAFRGGGDAPEMREWAAGVCRSLAWLPRRSLSRAAIWMQRGLMLARGDNLVYDRRESRFFEKCFLEWNPDILWLETPYLMRCALEWAGATPMVVDYWGTSEGAWRDYIHARGMRKAWEFCRWRLALNGEMRYAPRARLIVTVSKADAGHFRRLAPESRIWTIPIGVAGSAAGCRTGEDSGLMIMTGDFSYRPNVDAACFFVREILPLIRAVLPAARARFVGRNPAPDVVDLAKTEGVEVGGYVPDLKAVIAEAAVYILPMRLGSGIRSKLFDVFPMGKAIVTTSVGAEGLDLRHGENCVIADSPVDFALACRQLLQDAELRRKLGASVLSLARTYSQENAAALLRQLVEEATRAG